MTDGNAPRRSPPPWVVDRSYVVRDANGQQLAGVYARATEADARQAKVLTMYDAHRIAVNIAKLPGLLRPSGNATDGMVSMSESSHGGSSPGRLHRTQRRWHALAHGSRPRRAASDAAGPVMLGQMDGDDDKDISVSA